MRRKRVFGTEAVWRERLVRFRAGGLKVAGFCRREGVSSASFYRWRGRLEAENRRIRSVRRKGGKPPTTDGPERFLPVNVTGLSEAEIELPNGMKIRVPVTNVAGRAEGCRRGGSRDRRHPVAGFISFPSYLMELLSHGEAEELERIENEGLLPM